jgi:hypothetical protein
MRVEVNHDRRGWREATARFLAQELDGAADLMTIPLDPASDLASMLELLVPDLLQAASDTWRGESLDGFLDGHLIPYSSVAGRIVAAAVVMSTQTLTPVEIDYMLTDGRDDFDQLDVRLGQASPDEALRIRHHRLSQAVNVVHDLSRPRAPIQWAYTACWTR